MKAARAGHLCTVQFLISKGAPLTNITLNHKLNVSSKDNILLAYWPSRKLHVMSLCSMESMVH